jgi:hypothetical protein
MKILAYVFIVVAFILVTFFGLGPVLLADGGFGERMITLAVVLGLYAVLIILFRNIRKKNR